MYVTKRHCGVTLGCIFSHVIHEYMHYNLYPIVLDSSSPVLLFVTWMHVLQSQPEFVAFASCLHGLSHNLCIILVLRMKYDCLDVSEYQAHPCPKGTSLSSSDGWDFVEVGNGLLCVNDQQTNSWCKTKGVVYPNTLCTLFFILCFKCSVSHQIYIYCWNMLV